MFKKFLKHFGKDSTLVINFFSKSYKNPKIAVPIVILIAFIIFNISLNIANADKITYGIKMGNEKIGGIPLNRAKMILGEKIKKFENGLRLKIGNEVIYASLDDLGISIDIDNTVEIISAIGKNDNFLKNSMIQLSAFATSRKVNFELTIDSYKLELFVKNKFSNFENPAKNVNLIPNEEKNDFILTPPSNGTIIDREKLLSDILYKINNLENENNVELTLINDSPKVTEDKFDFAREKSEKIISSAPIILKYENKEWTINKNELSDMLSFQPEFFEGKFRLGVFLNEKLLSNQIAAITPALNQEPINAVITQKDGKIIEFAISRPGLRIDSEKNIKMITEKILNPEESTPEINLDVDVIQPKISTKNIENMGITSLLAKGESDFTGSTASRIHNIKIGAEKLNGILIKPDEEFSFNATLGEVNEKSGFKSELVIKRGKTIPEFGGGLCQVSTTAFRAAILAGIPILERQAHAYPVKYYNPQGFDATIYPPNPDLKFKNDTPGNILIQTRIKNSKLYFEFYGTDDGRKVKIDGPKILEKNKDGSMKTILTREVYNKDGDLVRNSNFRSNYKSPALYPIYRNPLE